MDLCDELPVTYTDGTLNVQSDVDVFHLANEVKILRLSILDFQNLKIDLGVVSKALLLPGFLIAAQSLPWL